jgi:hypothetical protein
VTGIRRDRLTAIALMMIVGFLSRDGAASDLPPKLDEATAQTFAALAAGHEKSPNDLDYQGPIGAPFFVFYGENPPPMIGGFGYFAVNPWTGDVWALWGCHKLSTPALRKSQAEIRRRFTRQELKQYAHLSRLKPDCIVED